MEFFENLNRETRYALLSSIAAGLVSFFLLTLFIDMFNYLFILAVMIAVFTSAFFAFRRQTRHESKLTKRRILQLAFEVGTLSHFYTFALYFPMNYFILEFRGIDPSLFGAYIISTLVVGVISIIMFIWVAVPMYIGIGHILKSTEKKDKSTQLHGNEELLDDIQI